MGNVFTHLECDLTDVLTQGLCPTSIHLAVVDGMDYCRSWTFVMRACKGESQCHPQTRSPQTDWVPRAPAAYTLAGHRDQVLHVAFHPSYNIIAFASDDSAVKIWDWDTGEFERTLKDHTRSVNDVDLDSKGNLLGETFLLRRSLLSSKGPVKSLVRRICLSKYGTLKSTGRTSRPWRAITAPYLLPALCQVINLSFPQAGTGPFESSTFHQRLSFAPYPWPIPEYL